MNTTDQSYFSAIAMLRSRGWQTTARKVFWVLQATWSRSQLLGFIIVQSSHRLYINEWIFLFPIKLYSHTHKKKLYSQKDKQGKRQHFVGQEIIPKTTQNATDPG